MYNEYALKTMLSEEREYVYIYIYVYIYTSIVNVPLYALKNMLCEEPYELWSELSAIINIHTNIDLCTHTHSAVVGVCTHLLGFMYMCAYIYIYIYIRQPMYVYPYVHAYLRMCVYVPVCIHVCVCMYINIHSNINWISEHAPNYSMHT
jgi:hypothetical protein